MKKSEYILSKIFLSIFFYIFCLIPVKKNKVVFASPRTSELDGNIKYIKREIEKRRKDINIVLLLEKYSYSFVGKIEYLLRLIRGMYHLATAKVFIVDNAYFPIHIVKHKKKTKVIQVWHACGALKKFGKDVMYEQRKTEDKVVHKNYDYVIVSSDFSAKHFATALDMRKEQMKVLGCARSDIFLDKNIYDRVKREFYEEYPEFKDKKIIVYAPTFRGAGKEKTSDFNLDLDILKNELGENFVFIYKPHMNSLSEEELNEVEDEFFHIADKEIVLNKLLQVCDYFITDYSSSIIEYSLLRKPLILYIYDFENYNKLPGFYLDFENEMIGEKVYNTKEIVNIIKKDDFDFSTYYKFIEKYFKYIDCDNTKRNADFIETLLDEK